MCISLVLYDSHPGLLLLLAFNRDEFWNRPTQPAHFWPDEPSVLAGRDALRNGTWLGVTRHGRFALLTNYREPMNAAEPTRFVRSTTAPSRGALTTNFLTSSLAPLEYLQSLELDGYFGVNLLVGDLHSRQVAFLSNRDPQQGARLLGPGHYGISNGLLQEWPKVDKCRAALAHALQLQAPDDGGAAAASAAAAAPPAPAAVGGVQPGSDGTNNCIGPASQQQQQQQQQQEGEQAAAGCSSRAAADAPGSSGGACAGASGHPHPNAAHATNSSNSGSSSSGGGELPWSVLFHHVMGDSRVVPPGQQVPLTGVGEELDRRLSAVFIEPFEMQPGEPYGTRSQTVIAVWRDGRVEQRERYVEAVQQQQQQGEEGQEGGEEEVTWVWREQTHEFELAPPPPAGEPQQHPAQEAAGVAAAEAEHWHMATGHLQPHSQQQ